MKLMNCHSRRLGVMGLPGNELDPGQAVEIHPDELERIKSRNATVRRWLRSGILEVVDADDVPVPEVESEPEPKSPPPPPPDELPEGVEPTGVHLFHHGAGYYDVYVDGIKVTDDRIRGKKKANEVADEYRVEE